jgi:ferredoxin
MRTFVDPDLCIASGLCIDTCPDIYEWGEEVATVKVPEVPQGMEDCALEAEEGCPTDAISHKD